MFYKDENISANISGVCDGDIGEINELLSQMWEARDDIVKVKEAEKILVNKTEEGKERIGHPLVPADTDLKQPISPDLKSGRESDGSMREVLGLRVRKSAKGNALRT